MINILLALRERERTGRGCKLDIAMADNLFTFMYWAMGDGLAARRWPQPGKALVTGGSPRYHVYRTRDDRFIAAAPLEERFWQNFCDAIGLARRRARRRAAIRESAIRAVAARIREKTAEEWRAVFAGKDLCCNVVGSIEEALADPAFPGARRVRRASSPPTARPSPPCRCRSRRLSRRRHRRLSGAGRGELAPR